ncbi:Mevalonate kinase [Liparis tanakae]|uniref:Mevalonate kinase n=1 Tax=Liparis tanakae TaxID=230148 RepID=A0A4Z2ISC8_9TELE|nr:Mevalonate kinase [Liparis tanakae]
MFPSLWAELKPSGGAVNRCCPGGLTRASGATLITVSDTLWQIVALGTMAGMQVKEAGMQVKEILVSAPGKVILHGEHAVVHGKVTYS